MKTDTIPINENENVFNQPQINQPNQINQIHPANQSNYSNVQSNVQNDFQPLNVQPLSFQQPVNFQTLNQPQFQSNFEPTDTNEKKSTISFNPEPSILEIENISDEPITFEDLDESNPVNLDFEEL